MVMIIKKSLSVKASTEEVLNNLKRISMPCFRFFTQNSFKFRMSGQVIGIFRTSGIYFVSGSIKESDNERIVLYSIKPTVLFWFILLISVAIFVYVLVHIFTSSTSPFFIAAPFGLALLDIFEAHWKVELCEEKLKREIGRVSADNFND